jgi:hypothetical protein
MLAPNPSLNTVMFCVLEEPTVTLPNARLVLAQRLTAELTAPLTVNEALAVAPAVVTALGMEAAVEVGIAIVMVHDAAGATPVQVLAESWNREDNPLKPLSVMLTLPSLRSVTLALGAAAPYQALPRSGATLVRVATVPVSVPATLAAALPLVAPAAVSVCAPWLLMVPPVVMVTVTTQVPPLAAALQVSGATEYGALSPLSVSVAAWLPLLVKVTVPLAFAPALSAANAAALLAVSVTALPLIVPATGAVAAPVVAPVAVKVCAP